MKKISILFFCAILLLNLTKAEEKNSNKSASIDYINAFIDTLSNLHDRSADEFMKMHCNSIKAVIKSKTYYTNSDSTFIKIMYDKFNEASDKYNAKRFDSYKARMKSLIMAWFSPTDGAVSFAWLKLPNEWNPDEEYPMYVTLHGLWDVATNPIEYLAYPYKVSSSYQKAYEDAYLLSPWGRGNRWYEGISETDIWECIHKLQSIAKVDLTKMYLNGHSMGGYGAWRIALNSPGYWAAVGIHAGALGHSECVNDNAARTLKNLPVYFVVGTNDGLLNINVTAFNLLRNEGNFDTDFVTFEGGHDYIENNVYNMYLWMSNYINDDFVDVKEVNSPVSSNLLCNPNPVRNSCNISYNIQQNANVELKITDLYGRTVKILERKNQNAGKHEYKFDASVLKPAIYILSLNYGLKTSQTRMVVVK